MRCELHMFVYSILHENQHELVLEKREGYEGV